MENQVSVDPMDVLVLKVILVLWVNWEGLDPLVYLDLLVTLDHLVSLEPQENKVPPVQSAVPDFRAASAGVTA
ncbi:hypothetical protein Q5P01_002379 [Channa striata]|uniref:Uncharacterized protein n=1 Tax=Channa striata TaxID=64152 RepID=A0AA88T3P3_CHASR|nr:hypothetical protein Q5P01_002379 [Channa striata]